MNALDAARLRWDAELMEGYVPAAVTEQARAAAAQAQARCTTGAAITWPTEALRLSRERRGVKVRA